VENEGHNLKLTQSEGDLVYEVIYCPTSYIIAKEFHTNEIKKENFTRREKELKGMEYFRLKIRKKNSQGEVLSYNLEGGQQGYYQRVDYLSYGMDENISLLRNNMNDTIKPTLFHFERIYGISPDIDFLISFVEDTLSQDNHEVFLLDDKILGGNVIRFDFKKDLIKKSPKLLVK
jgi:hypothetical protein